jgi:hypothetical protein
MHRWERAIELGNQPEAALQVQTPPARAVQKWLGPLGSGIRVSGGATLATPQLTQAQALRTEGDESMRKPAAAPGRSAWGKWVWWPRTLAQPGQTTLQSHRMDRQAYAPQEDWSTGEHRWRRRRMPRCEAPTTQLSHEPRRDAELRRSAAACASASRHCWLWQVPVALGVRGRK